MPNLPKIIHDAGGATVDSGLAILQHTEPGFAFAALVIAMGLLVIILASAESRHY